VNSVVLQAVYGRRWLIGITSIGLMLFSMFIAGLYPILSELRPSNPIIENMPVLFESFLGELSYLREFPTFIASQLFTIHLPLVLGIVAVAYGRSMSVAAERRGEFRTLLAQPVSRVGLVMRYWSALVVMLAICMVCITLGLYATLPFIEGDTTIAFSTLMSLVGMLWLYACTIATITFAIGIATGQGILAVLAGCAVTIFSHSVTIFSPVLPIIVGYRPYSLLEYVAAVTVAQYGVALSHIVIFLGVSLATMIVATITFHVRDISH